MLSRFRRYDVNEMILRRFAAVLSLSCVILGAEPPSTGNQKRISELIALLRQQPWPGAENIANPTIWLFHFTPPMLALLDIGPDAQEPLLEKLTDPEISDQIMILLGGVGDERSIGPLIQAMKIASSDRMPARRKKMLTAGNLALTNITVADVIWHHGGGITVAKCEDDSAECWSVWWQQNAPAFPVAEITESRRYTITRTMASIRAFLD